MNRSPSKWQRNEIKNLNDLYNLYKMNIDDIAPILNRSVYDINCKLLELKIPIKESKEKNILKELNDINYHINERINKFKNKINN